MPRLGAAALACAALSASVNARIVRWEAEPNDMHWLPPRETLGLQPLLGNDISPMPTPAPLLPARDVIEKRGKNDNTCAFVSGKSDIPLYCATTSKCVLNTERMAFGCCPDSSTRGDQGCAAWTTCLDSSEGARLGSTRTYGYTMWCNNSIYPKCIKHTFADNSLLGYSLWGCGKTAQTDLVFRSATDTDTTTPDSTTSTTSSSTSSVTTTTPPVPQPDQAEGPPLGPIIGGAVGGFAAIALLGFAIFFLIRRSRRTGDAHPLHQQQNVAPGGDAASPGGGPSSPGSPGQHQQGYGPQMADQQHQQGSYGFAPVMNNDPRASMAKPPYSVTNSVYDPAGMSPPHSPAPGYYNGGVDHTPSPPPPGHSPTGQPQQSFGAAWAAPQQQQQQSPPQQYNAMPPPGGHPPQQFQQPHQGYSELPTGRGDGELRELA